MPRRDKESFGEHHGKHKYISKNYQRDWGGEETNLEIKTNIEVDQVDDIEIKTEVELNKKIELNTDDYPDEVKEKRRKLIKKYHPDKNPDKDSGEKLKEILDDYG